MIVAVIALAALLVFFVTHIHRRLVWLPTGLLIGGAAGNLIDRVRIGAVTDFVKLPHWPAFNVADMCITFGVIVLIVRARAGQVKSPGPRRPASGSTCSWPRASARARRRSG